MIQIAIISDIHANLIALEKVLEDIDQRGITDIYCLGDLVDFAPWGNEVIAMLQKRNIPCLLGNHDERIGFNQTIIPLAHHDEEETFQRNLAINFSKKTITAAHKTWLTQRPYQLMLSFKTDYGIKNIWLVHASPRSNDEYIYESHSGEDLIKMLPNQSVDALVMGHTHISYIKHHKNILLVNCGSVGRSKENHRQATYCILNIANDVQAEIVKLEYDIETLTKAINESEIPDFYADFFRFQPDSL
ncbi:metallophosphoesterase family protein [Pedobacter miscanthi]|uniref:Metallophosphoesterase n=1 Tax=Pedobacter miscanthi TaxID=2259170 RepID=A0A366LBV5_9SPHI|nr:metallophosphoesterase family protein [Pedobacter miscanthi]RBQ11375.1 metallophosphoesterase [Pedobacter miscanthi]